MLTTKFYICLFNLIAYFCTVNINIIKILPLWKKNSLLPNYLMVRLIEPLVFVEVYGILLLKMLVEA